MSSLEVGLPIACQSRDLRLLRREYVERLDGALANRLAGGEQFSAGTLGERLGAESGEHVVGGTELFARVDATLSAAEPFAVEEVGASEVNDDPAAGEALDRLQIARLRVLALAHQRARTGLHPERPVGAGGARTHDGVRQHVDCGLGSVAAAGEQPFDVTVSC